MYFFNFETNRFMIKGDEKFEINCLESPEPEDIIWSNLEKDYI